MHLPNLLPCKHCRIHYKKYIHSDPIRLESRESLSRWLVRIHNMTNKQLGKERYAYSKVKNRYVLPYHEKIE